MSLACGSTTTSSVSMTTPCECQRAGGGGLHTAVAQATNRRDSASRLDADARVSMQVVGDCSLLWFPRLWGPNSTVACRRRLAACQRIVCDFTSRVAYLTDIGDSVVQPNSGSLSTKNFGFQSTCDSQSMAGGVFWVRSSLIGS